MVKYLEIEVNEEKIIKIFAFFIALIIFIKEVNVTLNYPIIFGDEGFHSALAREIAKTLNYPIYYDFLGDKLKRLGFFRPPLWNFLGASFFFLFGEIGYRILLPLLVFIYGIGIFSLIRRIIDEKAGVIALILSLTIPSFVTYSVLFYVDALLTLTTTFSFLFYLLYEKENKKKYLLLSILYCSLSVLTKAVGLAFLIFFGLIAIVKLVKYKFNIFRFLLKERLFASMLLLLIFFSSSIWIRNYLLYKDFCYFSLPFLSPKENLCKIIDYKENFRFSGRTEEVGSEMNIYKFGITNYLNFAYGNWLFFMLLVFGGLILAILEKRASIILFFLTFIIFFLKEPGIIYRVEDTARYTLGWSGFLCFLASYFSSSIIKEIKKYETLIFLLFLIIVFIIQFFGFTLNVYAFEYRINQLKNVKYFSPEFFRACKWVKENLPKNVTLLSLWTYRVTFACERKATGGVSDIRLSNDINLTIDLLKKSGIDYIFLEEFSIDPRNRHLAEKYDLKWVEFLLKNKEYFEIVYDSGKCIKMDNPLEQKFANISEVVELVKNGYICDGVAIFKVKG